MEENNHPLSYHIYTAFIAAICGIFVLLFRFEIIPALINIGAISIPLADIFIIVGAGLCGFRYSLFMFLVIFFSAVKFLDL